MGQSWCNGLCVLRDGRDRGPGQVALRGSGQASGEQRGSKEATRQRSKDGVSGEPGQESGDVVDRVVGDTRKHSTQVCFGICDLALLSNQG